MQDYAAIWTKLVLMKKCVAIATKPFEIVAMQEIGRILIHLLSQISHVVGPF